MNLALAGWALGVGLLQGFLHCVGMCGPFVLSFSIAATPKEGSGREHHVRNLVLVHGAHNLGRVLAFGVLGAIFGAVGSFVNAAAHIAGMQAAAGMIGGALMILWAIDQWRTGHGGGSVERWSLLRVPLIGKALIRLSKPGGGPLAALGAGFILGFHPCGLLFAVLLSAAASGSWHSGLLTLLAFGVGTVPSLAIVATAGWLGRKRLTSRTFSYLAAILMGASGLLFALRGMAFNGWIPSVNPWLF